MYVYALFSLSPLFIFVEKVELFENIVFTVYFTKESFADAVCLLFQSL